MAAKFLTSDEWDLIVDALVRTADAAMLASLDKMKAASDAKTHRLKKLEREHLVVAHAYQSVAAAMQALAEKIIKTPVDEVAGTIPGETADDPPWLRALRALNQARREHGL